jgi:hypothetical protein
MDEDWLGQAQSRGSPSPARGRGQVGRPVLAFLMKIERLQAKLAFGRGQAPSIGTWRLFRIGMEIVMRRNPNALMTVSVVQHQPPL